MAKTSSRALLIGCDFYFTGAEKADGSSIRFPHLRGAVRDVNDVETFLVNIGVQKDNIVKLTASHDPQSPLRPTEDNKLRWPTHPNIIRELKNITETSDYGSLIYIQFSGHGIQRGKVPEAKMSPGGDSLFGAALATTDVLEECGRYLTAHELGLRIQAMVEKKGLRVTVVLDACFSGRGLRKSTTYSARTIPGYLDDNNIDGDRVAEKEAFEYLSSISKTRQAKMEEDWLSKPVGCTVLTACGIQQTAGEDTFQEVGKDAGVMRGVLTHWMLDLLNQRRTPNLPSYSTVKEYVINKIKSTSPDIKQTPVLYGDAEYEFLGSKMQVRRPACRVLSAQGDKVILDIGGAQGVAVDAIYDIYPVGVDIENAENFHLAQEARIVDMEDFYSMATLADSDRSSVTVGSRGVLRTWALRDKVIVKFVPDEDHLKEALRGELEKTPNLSLGDGTCNEETFTVRIDATNNFEILERSPSNTESVRLQRLPVINVDAELAIPKLAHVLRHISRYRDIERLQDLPRSAHIREEKLEVYFFRGPKKLNAVEVAGVERFEAIAKEQLGLQLKYSGPAPFVCVTLFELNPSWGIVRKYTSKLVKNRLEPKFLPIPFRTEIPPKSTASDSDDTCDTFMVFIVEGEEEQSWDEIMLDALPIDAKNLRMDAGVDARTILKTRQSEMASPQTLPDRHWGVMSFVVHSSPSAEDVKKINLFTLSSSG
jgi:hypothetical protein